MRARFHHCKKSVWTSLVEKPRPQWGHLRCLVWIRASTHAWQKVCKHLVMIRSRYRSLQAEHRRSDCKTVIVSYHAKLRFPRHASGTHVEILDLYIVATAASSRLLLRSTGGNLLLGPLELPLELGHAFLSLGPPPALVCPFFVSFHADLLRTGLLGSCCPFPSDACFQVSLELCNPRSLLFQ